MLQGAAMPQHNHGNALRTLLQLLVHCLHVCSLLSVTFYGSFGALLLLQLLKEAMTGQEIDGRIWTAGAKTKDNLIADYRYAKLLCCGRTSNTSIPD
jgi:hypothetical protein